MAACLRGTDDPGCRRWIRSVGELRQLAIEAPLDRYVVGQVVYTLVRLGAHGDALEALETCQVEPWWCHVLRGFILAESGRLSEAEASFDSAVFAMPEDERCEWTDLSIYVRGDAWDEYEGEDCVDRFRRLDRFWWLADAAWIVPGNDRKVEHYSRMAWAALHDDALTGDNGDGHVDDGVGHSKDHHPTVISFGMDFVRWDARWTRPGGGVYGVIPKEAALVDPFNASADDWRVEPNSTVEHYRPAFGRLVVLHDFQVAFFERGDSIIATAATAPADREFRAHADGRAVLYLHTGAATQPITRETTARDGRWLFRVAAPRRRYIVGIEAMAADGVGRVRLGHGLPHADDAPIRLSDLLLYTPAESELPDSLEDALPLMRGSPRWTRGETMGVYVEVYGAGDAVSFPISVSLERQRGWLARLGAAIGIGNTTPVNVEWNHPGHGDRSSVSITLDLREADEGDHILRVAIGDPETTGVVAEKAVRIDDGG